MTNEHVHLPLLVTKKPNISFSEYAEWSTCTWKHYLKHIKKIDKSKPGISADFGTAIHAACENYLRNRTMNVDIAVTKFTDFWNKNGYASVEENRTLQEWLDELTRILENIPTKFDLEFKDWEFIDAEHPLWEEFEGFRFKGFIDGIIKYKKLFRKKLVTRYVLLDWKTSTFGWYRNKKSNDNVTDQLRVYKHFYAKKMGIPLDEIDCVFIILKRLIADADSMIEFYRIGAGDVTVERAAKKTSQMIKSVQKNKRLKNRWGCKYCDYFNSEHCDSWFVYEY